MSAEDLLAIYHDAARLYSEDLGREPTDCPDCGEPLHRTERGLWCPFVCGWKPC